MKSDALADLLVLNFDPLLDLTPFSAPERNIVLVMGGEIVRSAL